MLATLEKTQVSKECSAGKERKKNMKVKEHKAMAPEEARQVRSSVPAPGSRQAGRVAMVDCGQAKMCWQEQTKQGWGPGATEARGLGDLKGSPVVKCQHPRLLAVLMEMVTFLGQPHVHVW